MKPIVAIFSAPSGSGKSTIARAVVAARPDFAFSISATTRAPRGGEEEGRDYYFMSVSEFLDKVAKNEFIEYEEVYPGRFYGTTKAEVTRLFDQGKSIVFDVDVVGGLNLKKYFGEQAISFFIKVPSFETLKERLIARATESHDDIAMRLAKAEEETLLAPQFDHVVINDDLDRAVGECEDLIKAKLA